MKKLIRPGGGTAAVVLTLLLSACGGGGGGGGEAAGPVAPPAGSAPAPGPALVEGTNVPVTATSDSAAATTFASQLASSSDETGEPLALGNAVLASSETDEPAPLN